MENILKVTIDRMFHDMSISELKVLYAKNNPSDLSYHDTLYLNIIEGHPGEYTSSQIADLLQITRPAVTQKINELVKKGYVTRTQSEKDKRVHYLSLNPENTFYSDTQRKIEAKAETLITEKYGKEQLIVFCEMLDLYTEIVKKETEREVNHESK